MKLMIIRHGDPDYKNDCLTERGQIEANLLCDRLMKENITKVYCSPLGRAQKTAHPFIEVSGLQCTTFEWLREVPKLLNQPLAELGIADSDKSCCPWDMDPRYFTRFERDFSDKESWDQHPTYQADEIGEYCRMVFSSFDALLKNNGLEKDGIIYHLNEKSQDDEYWNQTNIAIFCHMGLGSLLTAYLANIAPPLFWQMFRFMPTSVNTIIFNKIAPDLATAKVFSFGDTSHLASIGLTYRG
jgi:broad specificity phosphatase PhoE